MRSLHSRALIFVASYLGVVVILMTTLIWYGRNTFGPENNHPASVSEALGPVLQLLLGAGIAGLIALILVTLYWLAAYIWPDRFRNRETEAKALKLGIAITLMTAVPLSMLATAIE